MSETIGQTLDFLFTQIEEKKSADPLKSYSASLVQSGPIRCAKKFGEEAIEMVIALTNKDNAEIKNEAADLLYHFAAALIAAGIEPGEVAQTLINRRAQSGHEEKANR